MVIDTRNGLAGDIMSAGLIGLGAESHKVTGAMERASIGLGGAEVKHIFREDVHRLKIFAPKIPDHLHAGDAAEFLQIALIESGIGDPWHTMGKRVLEVLVEAEGHVHNHHTVLKSHFHGSETVLHEAADIIMDIAGMAAGMMELGITSVAYIGHVNTGGGKVAFSHGTLDVPTPATWHILETSKIQWCNSDAGMEMTTPTGAAMLAGCRATKLPTPPNVPGKALAGGTRRLPPIAFFLVE